MDKADWEDANVCEADFVSSEDSDIDVAKDRDKSSVRSSIAIEICSCSDVDVS